MSENNSEFEVLASTVETEGIEAGLDFLVEHFRKNKMFHELFEGLKMRLRHSLSLPVMYKTGASEVDPDTQLKLENGLLEACREVGEGLIKQNRLQEGWMYLQPLGDQKLVETLLRSVELDEENVETMIEIGLTQGAAPELAFELVLNHYGTCNAITSLDMQSAQFDAPVRKSLAKLLVKHLHAELLENLRNHVSELGGTSIESASIVDLITANPAVMENGGHHVDTTHLASLMRIGRVIDSEKELQLLCDLASYGCALDEDFQMTSMPPFENTYVDHSAFYRCLLGAIGNNEKESDVDAADLKAGVDHFVAKTKTTNREEYGLIAFEILVDLLHRTGQATEAIDFYLDELLGKGSLVGIAPPVYEIADSDADRARLIEFFKKQDDLLSYSIGVFQKQRKG